MSDEKAKRSCFVGNIPYEATEDTLYQIFGEVGQVKGLRLVTDKETGKPKGYGFVEYADQSTAQSAIRNLSGREVHGRNLRVDSASQTQGSGGGGGQQQGRGGPTSFEQYGQNQGYRQEPRFPPDVVKREAPAMPEPRTQPLAQRGPPQMPPNQESSVTPKSQAFVKDEGKYGEPVVPKDAPESISRAVASLPPEQMHQLMKEMKECINNNPHEARNMLLQNPQLAYALLQAQVSMRIVDPDIAMKMLHRQAPVQPLIHSGVNTRVVGSKEKLDRLATATSEREDRSRRERAPQQTRPTQPKPVQPKTEPKQPNDGNDREKAQLIMQVMNLTNDQINMLPLEQRRSILELRAQLQTQGGSQ